jgi:hypothetical protein
MTEYKEGDTILLYPPCSQNPDYVPWTGREAVIIERSQEIKETQWCKIHLKGGVVMDAPVKWFRKRK